MTDKQIIIDEIDVSKCIYFQQEDDEYTCGAEECNGAIVACRACDNCYYKQSKRKEQECEELKEQLTAYIKEAEENFEVYTTLKDNYRKLKQTLTEIKEIAERGFKHSQCNCGAKADLDLILQKISEVEDGKV